MKTKITNIFSNKTKQKQNLENVGIFDTGSSLLNSYTEANIKSLLEDSAESKKNKGMSVRDFLMSIKSAQFVCNSLYARNYTNHKV